MRTKFLKISFIVLLFSAMITSHSFAEIPYVYNLENSGMNGSYQIPALSSFSSRLNSGVSIKPMPDPFAWIADPLGVNPLRSTSFEDWQHHRQEYLALFQHYEIGTKPIVSPSQITASYSGTTLSVTVTVEGKTLTLTSSISFPSGTGPFPVIIGMNSGTGSLPSAAFSSRGIASMPFNHDQVTKYGSPANTDPFFVLYPDLNVINTGQYAAWSWGVSRLIDGLYKLNGVLGDKTVDLNHIAVSGCSYAGKMALFAGALDERIALTIPQESGGGGATSWRYSATQSGVEGLAQTDSKWFKDSMFVFGSHVDKIPTDHHMLNALVAPRALFVTGNNDYLWLSNLSCYANSKATKKIYETLGIGDRFGFAITSGHGHCSFPSSLETALGYFLDKYMKGQTTLSTKYEVYPAAFDSIDHGAWTSWWGSGVPNFPPPSPGGNEYHWFEAERFVTPNVGRSFDVLYDANVSNYGYIAPKSGKAFTTAAPTDSADMITIPFVADKDTIYNIFARANGRNGNSNSFWMKIDNGSWVAVTGWQTAGAWMWRQFAKKLTLTKGAHKVLFAIRQAGSKLDKIVITNNNFSPVDPDLGGIDVFATPISGFEQLSYTDDVKIFQTVVNKTLNVELKNPADAIELFNTAGQQILSVKSFDTNVLIDMSKFQSGMYVLKVNLQGRTVIKKVIKS